MPIVVMKFGGTSVGSVERIAAVADRVVRTREAGNDVIVVVSAMGDTTDELLAMAAQITEVARPARARHAAHRRRADLDVAARDRAERARLPRRQLHRARRPGSSPTRSTARRRSSRSAPSGSSRRSRRGNVVILAGFQGLSSDYEITTLGRGGSRPHGGRDGRRGRRRGVRDLHRRRRRVHGRPADRADGPQDRPIGYEEMLELAAAGAKVLQSRSVEMARRHGVADPRALDVRRRARHVGARQERGRDGRRADQRRRARRPTRRRSRSTTCPTAPASRRRSSRRSRPRASTST